MVIILDHLSILLFGGFALKFLLSVVGKLLPWNRLISKTHGQFFLPDGYKYLYEVFSISEYFLSRLKQQVCILTLSKTDLKMHHLPSCSVDLKTLWPIIYASHASHASYASHAYCYLLFTIENHTVQKNSDKLPDRAGLPRYFRIEPDLNPADIYPDLSGSLSR